jgi:hypothetical protein
MTTQSEIFRNYVNDVKCQLKLVKSSVFACASSDWTDDEIAAYFKTKLESACGRIYTYHISRITESLSSKSDSKELLDMYMKKANIFFNTEVSYAVRDMCKDMDTLKHLLGLKSSHEHKRNCKPHEILEGVKAAIFAPGVTVSVSTKGDGSGVAVNGTPLSRLEDNKWKVELASAKSTNKSEDDFFISIKEMKLGSSGKVPPVRYKDVVELVDQWVICGSSVEDESAVNFAGKCKYGTVLIKSNAINGDVLYLNFISLFLDDALKFVISKF